MEGLPARKEERLPSNHGRIIEPPPFSLTASRARFAVKCTDEGCQKPRLVFSETANSNSKVIEMKAKIAESTFRCGDRIDNLKVFAVDERLHCTDDVEKVFYSGLVDSTVGAQPVCYSCGDTLNR